MAEIRTSLVVSERTVNISKRVNITEDNSKKPMDVGGVDLPLGASINEYLVMASPVGDIGRVDWSRVPTGGRAMDITSKEPFKYSLGLGQPEFAVEVRCMDFTVKGVGAQYFPGNTITTFNSDGSGEVRIKKYTPSRTISGRELPVRFDTNKTINPTGYMGFQLPEEAGLDIENSEKLLRAGVRTRKLVYRATLKGDIVVSTKDGHVKLNSLIDQIEGGTNPVITGWAIRSKYRLNDITWLRTRAEKNSNPEKTFLSNQIAFTSRETLDPYRPKSPITHDPKCLRISDKERDNLREQSMLFANELLKRMKVDDSEEFSLLSMQQDYSGGIDENNLHSFMRNYLTAFTKVYAEQLAIMQSLNAYMDPPYGYMFNNQNITALAELVDHDVTKFEDSFVGKFALNQLKQAWEHLSVYIRDLHLVGALPYEEGEDLRGEFLGIFFDRLSELNPGMKDEFEEYIRNDPFVVLDNIKKYISPVQNNLRSMLEDSKARGSEPGYIALQEAQLAEQVEQDQGQVTIDGRRIHLDDIYGEARRYCLRNALREYLDLETISTPED